MRKIKGNQMVDKTVFKKCLKNFSMKKALMGAAVLIGFAVAQPSSSFATSLEEAIRLSLEHNPRISIVARNKEAVVEELRQARGLYLPTIDMSTGVGFEQTSTPTLRAQNNGDEEDLVALDASLTVSQRLFDGWERSSRVDRQKARIQSAANRVYENAEVLALDVIGSYLDVIRQRELLALSRENVAFHVQTLEALVKRLRAGVGSRADVVQTQARLARSRATYVDTNNALADAEAEYTRLVGQFPGDLVLPEVPTNNLPKTMEELVRLASKNNPAVRVSEADVKVANADVDVAEASFYPQISLQGTTTYDEDADGVNSYTYQNSLGLRMNWNLFSGGTDVATRQELLMREEQAKGERFESVLEAEQEARRSWYAWLASQQRLQELSSSVVFNQETRLAYERQFQVGQRTLLDVLDAENELFTSRGQLISADINQMRASFRMLANVGELLKTLNISAPSQIDGSAESFGESIGFRN